MEKQRLGRKGADERESNPASARDPQPLTRSPSRRDGICFFKVSGLCISSARDKASRNTCQGILPGAAAGCGWRRMSASAGVRQRGARLCNHAADERTQHVSNRVAERGQRCSSSAATRAVPHQRRRHSAGGPATRPSMDAFQGVTVAAVAAGGRTRGVSGRDGWKETRRRARTRPTVEEIAAGTRGTAPPPPPRPSRGPKAPEQPKIVGLRERSHSCWLTGHRMGARGSKGVSYDEEGHVESCVFCRIIAGEAVDGTRVLYETPNLVVFRPREPAASHHFLVVSKRHIRDVNSLTASDRPLLEEMRHVGERVLALAEVEDVDAEVARRTSAAKTDASEHSTGVSTSQASPDGPRDRPGPPVTEPTAAVSASALFGFHTPPFNSIDHLHLHCFLPPFRVRWQQQACDRLWPAPHDDLFSLPLPQRARGPRSATAQAQYGRHRWPASWHGSDAGQSIMAPCAVGKGAQRCTDPPALTNTRARGFVVLLAAVDVPAPFLACAAGACVLVQYTPVACPRALRRQRQLSARRGLSCRVWHRCGCWGEQHARATSRRGTRR